MRTPPAVARDWMESSRSAPCLSEMKSAMSTAPRPMRKTSANQAASWSRSRLNGILAPGGQDVSGAARGMDQRRQSGRIHLPAQAPDEHVDDVPHGIEVIVPHVFQDLGPADHSVGIAQQVLEQGVFTSRQLDDALGP